MVYRFLITQFQIDRLLLNGWNVHILTGQDLDRVPDQGEDHDPVLDVGADVPGAGPTVDPGQGAGATVKVLVGVDHEASRPPDLQNELTMCSEKKIEPVHYSKSLLALKLKAVSLLTYSRL